MARSRRQQPNPDVKEQFANGSQTRPRRITDPAELEAVRDEFPAKTPAPALKAEAEVDHAPVPTPVAGRDSHGRFIKSLPKPTVTPVAKVNTPAIVEAPVTATPATVVEPTPTPTPALVAEADEEDKDLISEPTLDVVAPSSPDPDYSKGWSEKRRQAFVPYDVIASQQMYRDANPGQRDRILLLAREWPDKTPDWLVENWDGVTITTVRWIHYRAVRSSLHVAQREGTIFTLTQQLRAEHDRNQRLTTALEAMTRLGTQVDQLLARPIAQPVDLSPLEARLSQIEAAVRNVGTIANSIETLARKVEQILATLAQRSETSALSESSEALSQRLREQAVAQTDSLISDLREKARQELNQLRQLVAEAGIPPRVVDLSGSTDRPYVDVPLGSAIGRMPPSAPPTPPAPDPLDRFRK